MLKNLIFLFLSGMIFSAHAQSSKYDNCMDKLEYYFLASTSEASTVCRQESSPSFVSCMVNKALTSNIHVLSAVPHCASKRVRIPVESNDPTYTNLRSCPAKLQARARFQLELAELVCDRDRSPEMQNCLVDLVEKARFHSEHALQYCTFAANEYRKKLPNFVMCVIDNSQRGYDVYSNVTKCDDEMVYGKRGRRPAPRTENRPDPRNEPDYNSRNDGSYDPRYQSGPEVQPKQEEPVVNTPADQNPAPKKDRKVPTPVEIKIEGSSNPEVKDQPINTGTTENSESLPLD